MRRALLLVAVVVLAGCHPAPRFGEGERVTSSRYFTIQTDGGPEVEREVAPFLDAIVARVSSGLGVAPPAPASLAAIAFARWSDFQSFGERHALSAPPGTAGFYCTYGREIAFGLPAARVRHALENGDVAFVASGATVAATSSRVAALLRSPYQRARDLHIMAHEVTHQVASRLERGELPAWLEEGSAELSSALGAGAEALPEELGRHYAYVAGLKVSRGEFVLAARAACGARVFSDQGAALCGERKYAAHLGVCLFVHDRWPGRIPSLLRGRALAAAEVVELEASIGAWARRRICRRLAPSRDPSALAVIGLLLGIEAPGSLAPRALDELIEANASPVALAARGKTPDEVREAGRFLETQLQTLWPPLERASLELP